MPEETSRGESDSVVADSGSLESGEHRLEDLHGTSLIEMEPAPAPVVLEPVLVPVEASGIGSTKADGFDKGDAADGPHVEASSDGDSANAGVTDEVDHSGDPTPPGNDSDVVDRPSLPLATGRESPEVPLPTGTGFEADDEAQVTAGDAEGESLNSTGELPSRTAGVSQGESSPSQKDGSDEASNDGNQKTPASATTSNDGSVRRVGEFPIPGPADDDRVSDGADDRNVSSHADGESFEGSLMSSTDTAAMDRNHALAGDFLGELGVHSAGAADGGDDRHAVFRSASGRRLVRPVGGAGDGGGSGGAAAGMNDEEEELGSSTASSVNRQLAQEFLDEAAIAGRADEGAGL